MNRKDPVDRQTVLDAALAELVARGIDGFTVERVAERAGVEVCEITRIWGDRRVLMLDAQITGAARFFPVPDTGNLHDDLHVLLTATVELAKNPRGRRWVHRFVAAGGDADLSEVRADFWRVRMADLVTVLQRAADRGELREDVDPLEATRMFAAASMYDILVTDTPMRPEYLDQIVDIFIRGISKNPAP